MWFQLSTTDNLKFVLHFARFSLPLHPKASRAVPERVTRQPSFGNHGGQYDAEATFINFKTFQIMQQHIYYIRYALRFADMQISELVSVFNDQVQNRGWSSMRAYHDQALIDEFQRRGIDTTAVTGRKTISFVHPVRYDQFTNRLIPITKVSQVMAHLHNLT